MICFSPLWETMASKKVTTYTLRFKHGIVCGGSVGNGIFYITIDCVANLSLKIVKVECAEPM